MRNRNGLLVLLVVLGAGIGAACAPPTRSSSPGSGGGQGGSAGNGGAGGGAGGGPGASGSGDVCSAVGATRECSPAPCKRGLQACEKGTGTVSGATWSACRDVKDVPGCTTPDGGAACDCAKPTLACEDYCKGRDGGPPATCDGVCVCDQMTCGSASFRSCLPDGTWAKYCVYGNCKGEGLKGECQSHLDCPKKQYCRPGLGGPMGAVSGSLCWPADNIPAQACDTDADCSLPRLGGFWESVCKEYGECKCHAHGICVKECLLNAECPADRMCHLDRYESLGFPSVGMCVPFPKDLDGYYGCAGKKITKCPSP